VVRGTWSWYVVCGTWYVVRGAWYVVRGVAWRSVKSSMHLRRK